MRPPNLFLTQPWSCFSQVSPYLCPLPELSLVTQLLLSFRRRALSSPLQPSSPPQ